MTTLDAWLYGTLVARITRGRADRAHLEFTEDALERWGFHAPTVSGLLPLSSQPPHPTRVTAWLRGLMPEGRARIELARRAGVDPDDVIAFLGVYGQDTAGALVLMPTGADPESGGQCAPVDDDRVGELLDEARERGAAHQLNSLGGVETKIVLTRIGAGWAQPTGRTPSTHIVKLSHDADSPTADLIDTEAAALELARACGLTTVRAEIVTFAGRRALVVERYDRRARSDGGVDRIHQEDGAQLLGLDTTDPDRKFQWGRNLPSLRALASALTAMGESPRGLLALTTFNLAIGNTDAHAKNISVVHDDRGSVTLAPAYDVAMHQHHSFASTRFAMDVNGMSDMTAMAADDLIAEGRSWHLTEREAHQTVHQTLADLADAIGAIDRSRHPGVSGRAWGTVHDRTRALLAQAPPARRAVRPSRGPQPREARGTPSGGRFRSSDG